MTDYTELKRLADELIAANDLFNESPKDNEVGDAWSLANDRFTESASPEVIQALIAENETLTKIFADAPGLPDTDVEWLEKTRALEAERDQLKAENEALVAAAQALRDEWRKDQADAERYRWLRVKQTFIWLIQDWFPRNNVLTDVDAEIDAAMSKGEQS